MICNSPGIGQYERAHVERYETHAVIAYRFKGSKSWQGIEFDEAENAQEWNTPTLQSAAATRLGLPGDLSGRIDVIDFTTFEPPAGFFN